MAPIDKRNGREIRSNPMRERDERIEHERVELEGGRHRGAGLGRHLARVVADFVLPPLCMGCQRPLGSHDALCADCWRSVNFIRHPLCDRLGIPLPFDTGSVTVSAAALVDPPAYERARAATHFEGVARDLVHKLKYADQPACRRLLGRWLSTAGQDLLSDADVLVPVPLHRLRLLRRRFNQAAILADELSRLCGRPCITDALIRVKQTPQQVGLTRDQRQRNMTAAFTVPIRRTDALQGLRIVLIDDVITTGATGNACARALLAAGAARVDLLAVAIVADGAA
jgi:ComF family protein